MKDASSRASGLVKMLSGPAFRRATRPLMQGRTPVFMLHRMEDAAQNIHGHSIAFIRDCIQALRASGAKIVPLSTVVAGGPAQKAGLKAGDIVTKFADRPIEDGVALIALVRKQAPGTKVGVTYRRGGQTVTSTVTLGQK